MCSLEMWVFYSLCERPELAQRDSERLHSVCTVVGLPRIALVFQLSQQDARREEVL